MDILLWILLGIAIGAGITAFIAKKIFDKHKIDTVGTLQIDRSGRSRGPFIFLELDDDINWYKYTEVKLRVLNQDLASWDYEE